jgi:hypothetical protein
MWSNGACWIVLGYPSVVASAVFFLLRDIVATYKCNTIVLYIILLCVPVTCLLFLAFTKVNLQTSKLFPQNYIY